MRPQPSASMLLALLLGLPGAARAQKGVDGASLAERGLVELREGRLEAARVRLELARAQGVSDRELLLEVTLQLALLRTRFADFEGGYALLRHYASGGVDHPALTLAFGLSLLRVPRLPEEVRPEERERILLAGRAGLHMAQGSARAMRAFEELVSRYPAAPHVHYAYGTYLLRAKPQAARAQFERELRRDPSHREARIQIALDAVKTGNAAEGERLAREVIGETPGFFAAHLALGRALLAQDRVEEAIAALEQAAALAPGAPQPRFSLSLAYRRLGRAAEAQREQTEFRRLEALGRERGTLQLPE